MALPPSTEFWGVPAQPQPQPYVVPQDELARLPHHLNQLQVSLQMTQSNVFVAQSEIQSLKKQVETLTEIVGGLMEYMGLRKDAHADSGDADETA